MQGNMYLLRKTVVTIALASMFLLVQTAAPWLHVGCQHDHSHCTVDDHEQAHHGCRHHHHPPTKSTGTSAGHHHQHSDQDCAACRLLASPSVTVATLEIEPSESLVIVATPAEVISLPAAVHGRYRSRAPPLS